MLFKLAVRNARRSAKDYGIYVLTVTIIFTLLYAFNLIAFSKDIMELSQLMHTMTYFIIVISVLIVLVTGWLVHYMNRFMFQKRGKEFGTYMTLGISNKSIARLFLIENSITGSLSFLVSLAAGSVLYQVLTLIIMHVFKAQYAVKVTFSIRAAGLTFLYVVLIYAFSMIRTRFRIRKMKICDLLYADKKNETAVMKNIAGNWVLSLLSLAVGAVGIIVLRYNFSDGDTATMGKVGIAFLCIAACVYGFYGSISCILVKLFIENKRMKYQKDNLFLFRNLSAKMNTMRITLGTLALLLTLTMVATSVGMLFKNFFDQQAANETGFDITITSQDEADDFAKYRTYIQDHFTVAQDYTYPLYMNEDKPVKKLLAGTPYVGYYGEYDTVMRYSDYAKLRAMLGYKQVPLEKGHYILQCMNGVKTAMEKLNNRDFSIGSTKLQYQQSLTEPFSLSGINGAYYVVVVPDEVVEQLKFGNSIYVTDTKEETTEADYEAICRLVSPVRAGDGVTTYVSLGNITVRGKVLAEVRSEFTILCFSLFYIGLIFMCIAATVLAVQQLSEVSKYRTRYRITSYLGMNNRRIDGLILRQFLFYFGLPAFLPMIISAAATWCTSQLFDSMLNLPSLVGSMLVAVGLFLFVYLLYFTASYISFRKSVFEDASESSP